MTTQFRNLVFEDGEVQLNYPIKLFDRQRYIDMKNERAAAQDKGYYTRENARFGLQRPGRCPYVYNRQTLGCGSTPVRKTPCSATTSRCGLNYRYVACWTHLQGEIKIEVYYVGSREKAPY